jgi:hypothetical protein
VVADFRNGVPPGWKVIADFRNGVPPGRRVVANFRNGVPPGRRVVADFRNGFPLGRTHIFLRKVWTNGGEGAVSESSSKINLSSVSQCGEAK